MHYETDFMHYETDFLNRIAEAPLDDTARLVYADWLDEQGDARSLAKSRFIRAVDALHKTTLTEPAAFSRIVDLEIARLLLDEQLHPPDAIDEDSDWAKPKSIRPCNWMVNGRSADCANWVFQCYPRTGYNMDSKDSVRPQYAFAHMNIGMAFMELLQPGGGIKPLLWDERNLNNDYSDFAKEMKYGEQSISAAYDHNKGEYFSTYLQKHPRYGMKKSRWWGKEYPINPPLPISQQRILQIPYVSGVNALEALTRTPLDSAEYLAVYMASQPPEPGTDIAQPMLEFIEKSPPMPNLRLFSVPNYLMTNEVIDAFAQHIEKFPKLHMVEARIGGESTSYINIEAERRKLEAPSADVEQPEVLPNAAERAR